MWAKVIKTAVAIGLILWMFEKGHLDISALKSLFTTQVIVVCILLSGANLVLANARWQVLLKSRNLPSGIAETLRLYTIGVFFNYAIPGAVGGDVVKAYYLVKDNPERKVDAIGTVVLDRIFGLYSMMALALIAVIADFHLLTSHAALQTLATLLLGAFAASTLFFGAAFSTGLRRKLRLDHWLPKLPLGAKVLRIYHAIHLYGRDPWVLIKVFMFSFAAQLASSLFMIYIGFASNESQIPLSTYFFAVPLGFIASSLPLTPAGIGVGQVAFLVLFQMHSGIKTDLGQNAITAFQLAYFVWGLVGAYFYLRRRSSLGVVAQT